MMSTLFGALAAIVAISNAQYDDDCGTTTVTVGGEDLMMQLERDGSNEMVRITLTGPTDSWFGFIIGQGTMQGGYAITGDGTNTYSTKERTLLKSNGGSILESSGTASETVNGNAVLVLERPYAAPNGDSDYYDFTNLMTCQVSSVSIAAARGSGSLTYSQHSNSNRRGGQTYTSQCDCTDAPSKTPSSSPSASPAEASDTSEPSVSPVTSSPSTSPVTSSPTMSPEEATDDYVICGTSELINDVLLTVYKDAENEMVRIEVSGPSTTWFGYGFGASGKMIGSYAVTVEGADSDNLEVVQRTLTTKGSQNEPGTVLTGGTSSTTTSNTEAVGILTMAYDGGSFDFTDFLTCQVDSIDLIAAVGSGTSMGYHASRVEEMTLTRATTCTCSDEPTPTTPDDSANNIFNGFYVIIGLVIGFLFV